MKSIDGGFVSGSIALSNQAFLYLHNIKPSGLGFIGLPEIRIDGV